MACLEHVLQRTVHAPTATNALQAASMGALHQQKRRMYTVLVAVVGIATLPVNMLKTLSGMYVPSFFGCCAVWPTGNAPTVQAQLSLSNLSVIFGQTTVAANRQTGIASFKDLYMHAPNNTYPIQFSPTSDLVSMRFLNLSGLVYSNFCRKHNSCTCDLR